MGARSEFVRQSRRGFLRGATSAGLALTVLRLPSLGQSPLRTPASNIPTLTLATEWQSFSARDSEEELVIEALDFVLKDGTYASAKHLKVYADTIELHPDITLPGKDVLLHARRIICKPGASLDVSGPTE